MIVLFQGDWYVTSQVGVLENAAFVSLPVLGLCAIVLYLTQITSTKVT